MSGKNNFSPNEIFILAQIFVVFTKTGRILLYMPMGVDYVIIVFCVEVQPLVTHNAA